MLKMTDEQRYSAVLKELGEALQEKNTTISCQSWQIDGLKEKLETAEEERDFAKEKLADASRSIDILLADVKELKEKLATAEKERDEHLQHIYKLNDELAAVLTEMKLLKGGTA